MKEDPSEENPDLIMCKEYTHKEAEKLSKEEKGRIIARTPETVLVLPEE